MKTWSELARKWKETGGKYQYALLALALGALLMLLPSGRERDGPEGPPAEQESGEAFDLAAFERQLSEQLSLVSGAGETRVMLTLDSGVRRILAQDVEREDRGGGTATTVTVGRGSGRQEVVPLQLIAPEFRGALVVSRGGNSPEVRLQLTRAVSALTGLGADQISVCPGSGA